MTIYGWLIFVIASIAIFGIGLYIATCISDESCISDERNNKALRFKAVLISIILCGSLFAGLYWFYNHTEGGKRAVKTQESNFNGGVRRRVSVYDAVGNLLQEWDGRFDVDYSDERILFDDENRMRHIVYFKNGTVIVEEIE